MIKIALAQCKSERYEKEANLKKAEHYIKEASKNGANLILFPEMFTTGYLIKSKISELAEDKNASMNQFFSNLAKQNNIAIVYGFPEKNEKDGTFSNSACFIDRDGSCKAVYRKTHLFGDVDCSMFKPGNEIFAFNTSFGVKMCIIICYDIEFPETARLAAIDGAKVLCAISANMFPYEEYHLTFLKARAMENTIFSVYVNCVGKEDDVEFCGRSNVFSPSGKQLCCGSMDKEELLYADIDINETNPSDECLHYLKHRRVDLYQKLSEKLNT